jgi:hypothetical protein
MKLVKYIILFLLLSTVGTVLLIWTIFKPNLCDLNNDRSLAYHSMTLYQLGCGEGLTFTN